MKNFKFISSIIAAAMIFSVTPTTSFVKAEETTLKEAVSVEKTTEVDGITYNYLATETEDSTKIAEDVIIVADEGTISTDISIPEEIDGYTVTSIGSAEKQFMTAKMIAKKTTSYKVTIPNTVETINDDAFAYCAKLKEINIPNSVESIGNNTFEGCTSLETLTIPSSVESIGTKTFKDCTVLNIEIMNPNMFIDMDKISKWNVNAIISYDNSTASDYAAESGDYFSSLNDWNETTEFNSAKVTINASTGDEGEYTESDMFEDYDSSDTTFITNYYVTNNFKVPDLNAVPALTHYTFNGYKVGKANLYDNEGKPVLNAKALNTEIGKEMFTEKEGILYVGNGDIEDITLNADWEADVYIVNFNANNDNLTSETMPQQVLTFNKSDKLSKNTLAAYGYNFINWNTKANGSGDKFADGEKVLNLLEGEWKLGDKFNLYAQWECGTYKVTFKYPEDAIVSETVTGQAFTYNPKETETGVVIPTAGAISLKGYTFLGWKDVNKVIDSDSEYVTKITSLVGEDVILEADFSENEYTITYNLEEGKAENLITKRKYTEEVTLPTDVTKEGFTFEGWVDENGESISKINANTDENIVVTATYKEIPKETEAPTNTATPDAVEPTTKPTVEPTTDTTMIPDSEVTTPNAVEPAVEPTVEPTTDTTMVPDSEVTTPNAVEPTIEPTVEPTIEPTVEPTVKPTTEPTVKPSKKPTETKTPSNTEGTVPTKTTTSSSIVTPKTPTIVATPATITNTKETKEDTIKINLKNNKTYKMSKKVVIKASAKIAKIKINGKIFKKNVNKKKFTFKLKKAKKLLKKGKKNKIIVIDKNKNKKKVIFNV